MCWSSVLVCVCVPWLQEAQAPHVDAILECALELASGLAHLHLVGGVCQWGGLDVWVGVAGWGASWAHPTPSYTCVPCILSCNLKCLPQPHHG